MASNYALRALVALAFALSLAPARATADEISGGERSWEMQVGQQRYAQLWQRGEVLTAQAPQYAALEPIAQRIAAVANPQYYTPFHFILINEAGPNAFAMPGGNVYVTTGMLRFVQNQDELAGVLCHEVNHDIHHDVYNFYQLSSQLQAPGAYGRPQDPSGQMGQFQRSAESNADRAGAYLCAKAGFNPWGMVWNFRLYRQNAGASHAADGQHPSDDSRSADLVALFAADPATFGAFRDDIAQSPRLAGP